MTEPLDSGRAAQDPTSDRTGDADAATLERVAAGDLAALDTLYERYKSVAFAVALRITADPSLAEDVVQDAFIGVWRNASRYADARGSVRTWLLSIVHHRAIDAVRRRRTTAELPEGDEPPPPSLTLPDVWHEVAGRLDAQAVRAAMARLSDVQRQALELGYWSGFTQLEIAEKTGIPLGTVKSRMRLGLLALRRELLGTGGPDGGGDEGAQARAPLVDLPSADRASGLLEAVRARGLLEALCRSYVALVGWLSPITRATVLGRA